MNFHIDYLLRRLREEPARLLRLMDDDPMLSKREREGLIIANARQALFTPQEEHHLFAKGIVYQRDPYRLISLPLIKIYNLGEHDVTATNLAESIADGQCRFLRKVDGTMIQRFQHDGRVWLSTRGVLEGTETLSESSDDVPYLRTARDIAARHYPNLLEPESDLSGLSLVFELIHPQARVITDYGDREDLVLLAGFDHRQWRYLTHAELTDLAEQWSWNAIDAYSPRGTSLSEQIDGLLAQLAGTDQEGSVINFERHGQVVYRVKVKSPDYLRVLKLMVNCSYSATAEILDTHAELTTWEDLRGFLEAKGKEAVPEELLGFYEEHYRTHMSYLEQCDRLAAWAKRRFEAIRRELTDIDPTEPRAFRKAFAERVRREAHPALLFLALDDRLTRGRIRRYVSSPADAQRVWGEIESADGPK